MIASSNHHAARLKRTIGPIRKRSHLEVTGTTSPGRPMLVEWIIPWD